MQVSVYNTKSANKDKIGLELQL